MNASYSDLSIEVAVQIVEAYLQAGQPQRIVPALRDHRSPESVTAELAGERAARPATPALSSATPPASDGSVFGGLPTPEQSDALTAAIKQRMASMYGAKSAG